MTISLITLAHRLSPHLNDKRQAILIAFVFAVIASLSEGFGVGMMVPLLQSLFDKEATANTFIANLLKNIFDVDRIDPYLQIGIVCLIIAGAVLFKNFFNYQSTLRMAKIRETLVLRLRQAMFIQLQTVGLSFFSKHRLGDLMQTQFGEVDRVKQGFDFFLQLISKVLTTLVFIVFLLFISLPLTVLTVAILGTTLLLVNSIQKIIRRKGESMTQSASRLNANTLEALSGIGLIKVSASEEQEIQRFNRTSRKLFEHSYAFEERVHLIQPISETVGVAAALAIIFCSYTFLVPQGIITSAALLTFVFILLRLLPLGLEINFLRGQISFSLAAFDRILHLLKAEDKPFIKSGVRPFAGLTQGISLHNVTFAYEADRPVIYHASLDIPRGKTVALVGSSGSGKSTLTKLILRFYDVNEGCIEIDGINIKEFELESLRQRIAVVSQETFLFNLSVRDNLAYGIEQVSDEEIIEAACKANAHQFISELPEGYDTIIGDRGVRLSGGQRQRLSIARALLRNPDILILDEATSNLDPASERLVQEALERVCQGRTTIIIAHRFSTIERAERIFVLERGKVVEQGTWRELIDRKGTFWELYRLQCVSV